ncbi:MAG: hypothetical protein CMF49_03525 [Legionellales bacterium]|nr:hypothetical protein [Legionellales bacterium]|tara:strand:- start:26 stop:376 length:351 start_codon:yes stop_codon:yes gene_type:complete
MSQHNQLTLVNQKMPVFKGCTLQEVGIVFFLAYGICFVILAFLSESAMGTILPAVILNILPAILLTWVLLKIVGRLKEGKPLGYAQIKINLWFARLGIKKNTYITESKQWSIGRYE